MFDDLFQLRAVVTGGIEHGGHFGRVGVTGYFDMTANQQQRCEQTEQWFQF